MPELIYPSKLRPGDVIRVIAPSYSMKMIPMDILEMATKRLEEMGLRVTFGKNTSKKDIFESSPIECRLADLMEAFEDKSVKGIVTAIGGYNVNYLLRHINWEVIRSNPKFICGLSDITVLLNAIFAKTGLITFSGPNFRNFGQKKYVEYTLEYFKKIAFSNEPFEVKQSEYWSDDKWVKNQDKRNLIENEGWWVIREGKAEQRVLGGNLCSFNLLQGTEYMPDIRNKIIFIEDDSLSSVGEFSRNWQSLVHLFGFETVKGIVVGRFQKKTKMTRNKLTKLVLDVNLNKDVPVIANVDFGHTDPKFTFPIGGEVKLDIQKTNPMIRIKVH